MKKITIIVFLSLALFGCATTKEQDIQPDIEELISVAKEVAAMFDYYDELNPKVKNLIVGPNEIGGQCGDYALAFVNIWNKRHPKQKAYLVIQQTKMNSFPDGIYRVIGKDYRSYSFLNGKKVSGLYNTDDGIIGIFHPILGNYQISLVKRFHVKYHFGKNMERIGRHVWVKVGDISIDPTYADSGNNIIEYDIF